MTPREIKFEDTVTFDQMRQLAGERGPCITVAIGIPNPLQLGTRIKTGIRGLEKSLDDFGVDDDAASTLMQPILSLASSVEAHREWRVDLVLYRSQNLFRYFWTPELTRELSEVSDRFLLRPLLSFVGFEQSFYLLTLSQKHVRLYRGTYRSMEEVALRGIAPRNLEAWLNARIPDHDLENRSAGGPSTGSMKGVVFGTSTDSERHNEHLAHFFREIDSGLAKILGPGDTPLIMAGVQSETSLYARVNTYSRLLPETVQGSPEKVPVTELHRRAFDIARRTFTIPLSKSLQAMKEQQGSSRLVTDTQSVLQAGFEGRVAALVLRDDAEQRGSWDEASQSIGPGTQDLLNLAALWTLSHGGQAYSLDANTMPEPASMAALLRF